MHSWFLVALSLIFFKPSVYVNVHNCLVTDYVWENIISLKWPVSFLSEVSVSALLNELHFYFSYKCPNPLLIPAAPFSGAMNNCFSAEAWSHFQIIKTWGNLVEQAGPLFVKITERIYSFWKLILPESNDNAWNKRPLSHLLWALSAF